MTKYELMLILQPDLGEEGTKNELEEVRKIVAEGHGTIHNEDLWGVRELSYRIKKHDEGYYAVLSLSIGTDKISEFEKSLNIHNSVLRFLLIKTAENYQPKTLKEYQAEDELAEKEEQAKKQEAENKKAPKPRVPESRTSKPAEPKKEVKEVKKEAPKAEEQVKEEPKPKLEEVDDKLKSIIDDPDISL